MKKGTQMHRRVTIAASVMCVILFACAIVSAQSISIRDRTTRGYLPVVQNGRAIPIVVANADHQVVKLAAKDLASDIEKVTGKLPVIGIEPKTLPPNAIIIGTLGRNYLIEQIVSAGKLDVRGVRGKWETFVIATVKNPLPGVASALVIVGGDRRGTAFGVYEFSQMLGVSPWNWWADVTPDRRSEIHVSPGKLVSREPSVKYRGIFLNDEDWGLQPWAAKTFEPETGDIGPKTYAMICELLLRLKANTLWPAMHEVTRPFNSIPENKKVADDYAIVMGSSHAEPMLRNNVGEWKGNKDDFNFVTNPTGVTEYWDRRVSENASYENIYTIGMRGIHDSPILGTKSQAERIPLLEKIFSVQRGMLRKYTGRNAENIPQIFCPYKEVLADYRAGLQVPDDVTIVFPDDNFGYIRQFPTAEERKRKGGFGIYYHISYLGRPLSYLWLNTTPPALIWQEMSKAYENGMRDLWIVNVGDIKPGEIGMEFFLQMAYDADRWTIDNQHDFLREWAKREFGEKKADEIADVMDEYYHLGFQRKPEHLQWFLPTEPERLSDLTTTEKLRRLEDYDQIRTRADAIYASLPASKKDAFYQLVAYPVRSAALANERYFAAEIAKQYGVEWPKTGKTFAERSVNADREIDRETRYFNETLAGGKWRHFMSPEMNPGQWKSMRSTPLKILPEDFLISSEADEVRPMQILNFRPGTTPSKSTFGEWEGVISINAENYLTQTTRDGFGWKAIKGLGRTGDSISVFPNRMRSFDRKEAPTVEYQIEVETEATFKIQFDLIPTQPLVPGNGLRLAFAVDDGEFQLVTADTDTEVSSRKWAQNILDQVTTATASVFLTPGVHRLLIAAVDTGVVLDKIVLSSRDLPLSYFGPSETRFTKQKRK